MELLSIRAATDDDRDAWGRFVAATPGSEAAHGWEYHSLFHEVFGARVFRLLAVRGEEIVGLLPLVYQKSLMGRFLTSVPYFNYAGVLSQDSEARGRLAEEAATLAGHHGAQRLELRGRDGGDLPLDPWTEKSAYTLDLAPGSEELWKRLTPKVRTRVRRCSKEGYTTRLVDGVDNDAFYALLARRWHQLGSPILPRRFFDGLGRLLGDALRIVVVEKDGEPAAAGALVEWQGRVEISWSAADVRHNRYGVNMLLYWTAIEATAAAGASVFDMGRSSPGTGTASFKLQWGATETPLVWNVRTAGSQGEASVRGAGRRELFAGTWRRLPHFVADWLGPRLAAWIPY
jgi:FemAB-related protein (PEP-CTERM system-associated)